MEIRKLQDSKTGKFFGQIWDSYPDMLKIILYGVGSSLVIKANRLEKILEQYGKKKRVLRMKAGHPFSSVTLCCQLNLSLQPTRKIVSANTLVKLSEITNLCHYSIRPCPCLAIQKQ